MYVSTLLTFAIATFSVGTYAGCYSNGELGYSADGISAATIGCNTISGDVGPGQTKSTCVNAGGIRWNLTVKNTSDKAIVVGTGECISEMTSTSNGCPGNGRTNGGVRDSGPLQTKVDPNAGSC